MGPLGRIYRIARWLTLTGLIITIFLMLKAPAPLAQPLSSAQANQEAQNFQQKLMELANAQPLGGMAPEISFSAREVNAALEQATLPQPARAQSTPAAQADSASPIPIQSTQVSFEGDVVKGQFLAQVYGRNVYLTVAGHLGCRNGYATFDPTEFKVGDLSMPVSLVNPALQHRLADPENHEKLKLPDFVKGLRVENGELVITR